MTLTLVFLIAMCIIGYFSGLLLRHMAEEEIVSVKTIVHYVVYTLTILAISIALPLWWMILFLAVAAFLFWKKWAVPLAGVYGFLLGFTSSGMIAFLIFTVFTLRTSIHSEKNRIYKTILISSIVFMLTAILTGVWYNG